MSTKNERASSAFYDSVYQRDIPDLDSSGRVSNITRDFQDYITGRLRLDSLISEKVVMPDTRVLDGAFFLRCNPQELIGNLKRHPLDQPLEIQMRASTIAESLLGFVKKADAQRLSSFSFSSILDSKQRIDAAEALREIDSSHCKKVSDIPALLEKCGVDADNCALLEQSWELWANAADSNDLVVKQWSGGFDLDGALGLSREDALPACNSVIGSEVLNYAVENRKDRSAVDSYISKLGSELSQEEAAEIRLVSTWLNKGYNQAIARQHKCDTFESPSDSENRIDIFDPWWARAGITKNQSHSFSTLEYQYPLSFLWALGRCPSEKYQSLYTQAMDHLRKWWQFGDIDSLRRGLDVFTNGIDHKVKISDRLAQYTDAVGAAIAGGGTGLGIKALLTAINEEVLTAAQELAIVGGGAILGGLFWMVFKGSVTSAVNASIPTTQKIITAVQQNRESI